MTYDASKLYAVIMAGGRGERFWPAGRRDHPKQFLPLLSTQSLIEDTVQRLFPLFAPERVLVITNHAYVDQVRALLPVPAENVIGEPEGRDTAPCVALATAIL
ncbi:MAG: NTP transferase domain-containing protein, partial [Lentisphaerae bacterium]|nr:NTP transferase domain-containing protein [Lentisphaerota bacterium]